MFAFAIIAGFCATTLCALAIQRLCFHQLSKYPGPKLAILSDWYAAFFAWRGDLHIKTRQWHDQYGPVLRLGPNSICFNDLDAYHQIYSARANALKNDRYAATSASSSPNTVSAIDKTTVNSKRKAHLNTWNDAGLKEMEPRLLSKVATFLDALLKDEGRSGAASDIEEKGWGPRQNIYEIGMRLVTDFAVDATFNEDPMLLTSEKNRWIPSTIKVASRRAMASHLQPKVHQSQLDKILLLSSYKKLFRMGYWAMDMTTKRRDLGTDAGEKDLFHTMLSLNDKGTSQGYRTKDLWLEAYLMAGVGSTTSGPTMVSLFFFLIHYPHALERLVSEIRSKFSKREDICLGPELSSCSYLQACIDETLRMVPGLANILAREVQPGGMVVCGHFMPAKTIIGSSLYSLHRDERYFSDPEYFKPERYLEGDEDTIKATKRAWNAFGVGPRACVGPKFAYAVISVTVASTLFEYDMRLAPDAPCCGSKPATQKCTDRDFGSFVGTTSGDVAAQFRPRVY